MPVYDYICNDCKKSFETVLTLAEHDKERISCPHCGSKNVEQEVAAGGVDENLTWAWTGTDWTQLQPAKSPAARESLGMAYDAASRQFLIFGGDSPSKFFHDTWKLVGH